MTSRMEKPVRKRIDNFITRHQFSSRQIFTFHSECPIVLIIRVFMFLLRGKILQKHSNILSRSTKFVVMICLAHINETTIQMKYTHFLGINWVVVQRKEVSFMQKVALVTGTSHSVELVLVQLVIWPAWEPKFQWLVEMKNDSTKSLMWQKTISKRDNFCCIFSICKLEIQNVHFWMKDKFSIFVRSIQNGIMICRNCWHATANLCEATYII